MVVSKIDAAASALVVVSVCVSATTDSTAAVSAETVHKVTQFCVCVCVLHSAHSGRQVSDKRRQKRRCATAAGTVF